MRQSVSVSSSIASIMLLEYAFATVWIALISSGAASFAHLIRAGKAPARTNPRDSFAAQRSRAATHGPPMHKMQRDLSASPLLPPCPCFTCGRDLLATWRKPSCLPRAMASAHAPTQNTDCCKPAGILGTHTFSQSVCHARERYDSYDSYREHAARAPSSHTSHRRCQGPSSADQ